MKLSEFEFSRLPLFILLFLSTKNLRKNKFIFNGLFLKESTNFVSTRSSKWNIFMADNKSLQVNNFQKINLQNIGWLSEFLSIDKTFQIHLIFIKNPTEIIFLFWNINYSLEFLVMLKLIHKENAKLAFPCNIFISF